VCIIQVQHYGPIMFWKSTAFKSGCKIPWPTPANQLRQFLSCDTWRRLEKVRIEQTFLHLIWGDVVCERSLGELSPLYLQRGCAPVPVTLPGLHSHHNCGNIVAPCSVFTSMRKHVYA